MEADARFLYGSSLGRHFKYQLSSNNISATRLGDDKGSLWVSIWTKKFVKNINET